MSSSMDDAIGNFVFAHAQKLNLVPADCIWMGDVIADFIHSSEYLLTFKSSSSRVQKLRPEVLAFALLMEKRLLEKDAEKSASWKNRPLTDLAVNITMKQTQLASALRFQSPNVTMHAVDLGNYCMMVAGVSGALQQPKAIEQPDEWRCA